MLVKNSIALAFSLAGIVAAVRFRNTLDDSKDAVYILVAAAIGIACGVQVPVAIVLSIGFNIVTVVLWYTDFGRDPAGLGGALAEERLVRTREQMSHTHELRRRRGRRTAQGDVARRSSTRSPTAPGAGARR